MKKEKGESSGTRKRSRSPQKRSRSPRKGNAVVNKITKVALEDGSDSSDKSRRRQVTMVILEGDPSEGGETNKSM